MRVLYVSLSLLILDQLTKLAVRGFSIPVLGIAWEDANGIRLSLARSRTETDRHRDLVAHGGTAIEAVGLEVLHA